MSETEAEKEVSASTDSRILHLNWNWHFALHVSCLEARVPFSCKILSSLTDLGFPSVRTGSFLLRFTYLQSSFILWTVYSFAILKAFVAYWLLLLSIKIISHCRQRADRQQSLADIPIFSRGLQGGHHAAGLDNFVKCSTGWWADTLGPYFVLS